MQTLFQMNMSEQDLGFLLEAATEAEQFLPETVDFARQIVEGVHQNMAEIDRMISEKSIGWSLERITNVDRAILRMAIYELVHIKTPASVVINEAVNLAKKFSTAESSKFINGILGNLVK